MAKFFKAMEDYLPSTENHMFQNRNVGPAVRPDQQLLRTSAWLERREAGHTEIAFSCGPH